MATQNSAKTLIALEKYRYNSEQKWLLLQKIV